jgi:hypothetical protein
MTKYLTQRHNAADAKLFGVRWQSAAATPLFDCGQSFQGGVALRFPPQSKKNRLRLCAFAPLH